MEFAVPDQTYLMALCKVLLTPMQALAIVRIISGPDR